MTVRGAYGRTYRNQKQIQSDWDSGKDFVIVDIFHGAGRYVNRADIERNPVDTVMCRYDNDRKVYPIKTRNR